jgi:cytidylate kinase
MVIAIDGPAGAGKSTVAKFLAKKLGFVYLDTGAMYRAIGLKVYENGCAVDDSEGVKRLLDDSTIEIKYIDGVQTVWLDGNDVSKEIRLNHISKMASDVSALPFVREKLVAMQRRMSENGNYILDGRDIGTVVFPNAEIKFFLTASVEERATRRYKELLEKGQSAVYETVKKEIEQRDYNDSHRKTSPLKKADDAIELDTTGLSIEEVCARIEKEVSKVIDR